MEKIHSDLKGVDFNKKLVWKTKEGFDVKPFYRMEDIDNLTYINILPGEFPYIRGIKIRDNSWYCRQNITVTDYTEANRKALDILMKGVDSLGFEITDPESVNEANFSLLLHDIKLETIEVNFLCNGKAKEILAIITKLAAYSGLDKTKLYGAIEADPVGRLMVNGKLCVHLDEGFDYLASLTASASVFPNLRTVHLNASAFNNAGADIVQELAFGLAMGSEYMTQLTDRGLSADTSASCIRFNFGTGSDYFPEIAKLRAARLLWSVVTTGYKASESVRMNIHCVTSRWNKTVYDPYVNMLRTQTEAMSAILGGADSVTVEPFDTVFRQADEFSERIARNQQLILREEAYFDKVADPSAGSYYIEKLTNLIAENCWKLFLEIENKGGFLASLKSGFIQDELAGSAQKRKKDIATRRTVLLGTNKFANTGESLSDTINPEDIFSKKSVVEDTQVDPIFLFRGSEEYDKLRIAVDKASKRPAVFLMPIGNPGMRKARSQFAVGFFGCAGYHIIENRAFDSVEAGVKSALRSKADIVVLCSSDEEYSQFAPEFYKGLKDKMIIVIAGNPASAAESGSADPGIFINLRSDVTETLKHFNSLLGISL
jgi:methylmalonyl-CoA mutase